MTLDLTFMESHRTKIRQPSKYRGINHVNSQLNDVSFGKPCFGKRSD